MVFKGKNILVTGGTGSFGKAFVKNLLSNNDAKKVIVFSRDELKQFEMAAQFNDSRLRFFLGDVRDLERLKLATREVNFIVHAAAMKQIPASEYNPMEAIRTNILGAENIVSVAIENKVEKVIALSTDKAANPANLYGATKLCSDKIMMAGNLLAGKIGTKFSAVRYGNVLGSRGSVIPFFLDKMKEGVIPITDERMTRFWLTLNQGVHFVASALADMKGAEIFVPKIPSFKVIDVAKVVCPDIPTHIIGIRPGEKLHEVMITEDDALNTYEFEDKFIISSPTFGSENYKTFHKNRVADGFRYSSDNNKIWHTPESFKKVLLDNKII